MDEIEHICFWGHLFLKGECVLKWLDSLPREKSPVLKVKLKKLYFLKLFGFVCI